MTDLYELTMAYAYWKSGMREHEATFSLTFRKPPFNGGYTIACGLAHVVDYLVHFKFTEDDLSYLQTLRGDDDRPLFDQEFIVYLRGLRLSCDVDAIPEGTAVFPHEPLVRVQGPIIESQILESALLNLVNFQSLIATKAARIAQAAGDGPILEFGLRRAQGIDGALAVARAAYVGGCAATSNVLGGRIFDLPVKGTHAHSWVMAFDDEEASFQAFAEAQPGNCILLVDTYDTLDGVRRAVRVAQRMRSQGHRLIAVRLDSGDLAYLSIESRKILDEAGLEDVKILASGDLDEHLIESLLQQGARIDMWGVGTRLVTAYDDPALGGVYKLTALRKPGKDWQYKVKLSEQIVKTSIPGIQQLRRFERDGSFEADMIYDERLGPNADQPIVHPTDPTRRRRISPDLTHTDVLVPILRKGRLVYEPPSLESAKKRCAEQLEHLHPGIKRLVNPHEYPAGLQHDLHEERTRLIMEARGEKP
jgi:nicotinate phosphoribosyltransferase